MWHPKIPHENRSRGKSDRGGAQGPQETYAERGPVPGDEAPRPLRKTLGQAQAQAGSGAAQTAQGHAPAASHRRRIASTAPAVEGVGRCASMPEPTPVTFQCVKCHGQNEVPTDRKELLFGGGAGAGGARPLSHGPKIRTLIVRCRE